MRCPLCRTLLVRKIDQDFFDCPTCTALVKDASFYIETARELAVYEGHNNDVEDPGYQNFTSPITNYILECFGTNAKGLDFGCGTGPVITKILRDNGYDNIHLYDPFFHPDHELLEESYDFIFACEVVEHFAQPREEYQQLLDKLPPGGRLLIMTHPYDGKIPFPKWYYRRDPTHIFIHRKPTFVYIAELFNVELEYQGKRLTVLRK